MIRLAVGLVKGWYTYYTFAGKLTDSIKEVLEVFRQTVGEELATTCILSTSLLMSSFRAFSNLLMKP